MKENPMRQNFNLFTKMGRENAIQRRFDNWTRKFLWRDTIGWRIGRLICRAFGHRWQEMYDKSLHCFRCDTDYGLHTHD